MATVSSPTVPSPEAPQIRSPRRSGSAQAGGQVNSEVVIAERIAEAQSALWRAELSRSLLVPVVATLVVLTLWAVMDHWIWSPGKWFRTLALFGGIAALGTWIVKRVWPLFSKNILPEYAAFSLEHDLPELRHSLTSYVTLQDDQKREGVRGVVMRSIGVRAAGQLQSHAIEIPSEATGNLRWWLGVAGAIAFAAAYALFSPKDTLQSTQRLLLPMASIDAPSRVQISDVKPGDIEVLAGRPFDVSAMIVGLSKNEPPRVEYGSDFVSSKTLEEQTETGRHQATITVDSASSYRIVAGDSVAGPFAISTRNVPIVSIDQVQITPPIYTKLPPRQSRGGAIVGEENGIVKMSGSLNLPIDRARVEFNPRQIGDRVQASGGVLDMTIVHDGLGVEATFPLRLPVAGKGAVAIESYRLHVWDSAGNENPEPIIYPIRIVADLAPEVSITSPRALLTEVPLNGAQRIEIHAMDPDYGLKQIDLKITRGVREIATETVWSSVEGERGNQTSVWLLQPTELGLHVDETIQVVAVASDNRHDVNGKLASNVITSDPVELKIVAPQENSQAPKLEDKNGEGKAQASEDSAASEGEHQQGDKKQQGQGGSGQGQQGQESQGESSEGQKGQSGKGKSGGEKQDEAGEGQSDNDSAGGSQGNQSKPPSDGSKQGDMKSSPPSEGQTSDEKQGDGQQDESDPSSSTEGQPGSSQGQPGSKPGKPQDASNDEATNQEKGGQDQSGGPAQKPQHDGDAFERIREYLDRDQKSKPAAQGEQSNKGEQSKDEQSKDEQARKDDQSPSGDQSKGGGKPDSQNGSKPEAVPKTGEQSDSGDKQPDGDKQPKGDKDAIGSGSDAAEKPDANQTKPDPQRSDAARSGKTGEQREQEGNEASESGKPDSAQPNDASQESGDRSGETNDGAAQSEKPQSEKTPSTQSKAGDKAKASDDPKSPDADPSASGADGQPEPDGSKQEGQSGEQGKSSDPSGKPSPDGAADKKDGKGSEGKQGEGKTSAGEQKPSDKKPGDKVDQAGKPSESASDKPGSDASRQPENQDGTSGTTGGGDAGEGAGSDANELVQPPDPVNVEEAKKATDLVLDYLDQQRDTPDPELLNRLDWTPDELREFADRWNRIRDLEKSGSGDKSTIEEALRSLGIRKNQTGSIGKLSDTDDALRGLKDAGNRAPAPPVYRDAFDAFRRNVNRNEGVSK